MPKSPMQTKAKSNDTMMKGIILFLMLAAISVFVIGDANIAGTITTTNLTVSGTATVENMNVDDINNVKVVDESNEVELRDVLSTITDNSKVILSPSIYYTDGGSNQLRIENVSNIILDCQGATLEYNGTYTGNINTAILYLHNVSNVEISNCNFDGNDNAYAGILVYDSNQTSQYSDKVSIHDNFMSEMSRATAGIFMLMSRNSIVENNYITSTTPLVSSTRGIYLDGTLNNIVSNNILELKGGSPNSSRGIELDGLNSGWAAGLEWNGQFNIVADNYVSGYSFNLHIEEQDYVSVTGNTLDSVGATYSLNIGYANLGGTYANNQIKGYGGTRGIFLNTADNYTIKGHGQEYAMFIGNYITNFSTCFYAEDSFSFILNGNIMGDCDRSIGLFGSTSNFTIVNNRDYNILGTDGESMQIAADGSDKYFVIANNDFQGNVKTNGAKPINSDPISWNIMGSGDGMILHIPMRDNIPQDFSRYGNTITTYNSPTEITGVLGNGLYFDGTNEYIDIDSIGALESFSTCIWATRENATRYGVAFDLYDGGTTDTINILRYETDGTVRAYITAAGSTVVSYGNAKDSQWHHYCFTYNKTTGLATTYMDGFLADTGARGGLDLNSGTYDFRIGSQRGGFSWHKGSFDDARIWNRVITPEEVRSIFSMPMEVFDRPDGYTGSCENSTALSVINGVITGCNSSNYGQFENLTVADTQTIGILTITSNGTCGILTNTLTNNTFNLC